MADKPDEPIFSAVSSSARQLSLLLRCISFAPKAQVQISDEGLRFSVEESSVMEAMAFIEKSLFTSYTYNGPAPSSSEDDDVSTTPVFAVSLPSLLETLQIFGLTAEAKPNPFSSGGRGGGRDGFGGHAFSNQVLGVTGLCRLGYEAPGAPLTIILDEQGIRTKCELNTYEPSFMSDIPFSRDNIALKVIMRASYLFDAITELSAHNPQIITLGARQRIFTVSASSPLGSATVDFHRDAQALTHNPTNAEDAGGTATQATGLLETFLLAKNTNQGTSFTQSYKFSHISATRKALQSATKVSIRVDGQGVLSLQFMIENLEGGGVSFVDFRFVPLVGDEDEHRKMSEESEDGEAEHANGTVNGDHYDDEEE